MDQNFQPEEFVNKLAAGEFDGQLAQRIGELSDEQIYEVARILGERRASRLAPVQYKSANQPG